MVLITLKTNWNHLIALICVTILHCCQQNAEENLLSVYFLQVNTDIVALSTFCNILLPRNISLIWHVRIIRIHNLHKNVLQISRKRNDQCKLLFRFNQNSELWNVMRESLLLICKLQISKIKSIVMLNIACRSIRNWMFIFWQIQQIWMLKPDVFLSNVL